MSRIAKALTTAALAVSLAACSSVSLDDKAGAGGADGSGILDPFNPQSILAASSTAAWLKLTANTW
jgi:peptidoglycan-associated lipoprotein